MGRRRRQMSCEEFCALCCCTGTIAIVTLFVVAMVTLFGSPDNPTLWVDEFYIPTAFNETTTAVPTAVNKTQNHTLIYFGLKVRNENVAIGLHYDDINLTFSYLQKNTSTSTYINIGEYRVPRFYQGNGKTKQVRDFVAITSGILSGPVMWNGTRMMVFKLDVKTSVRFKLSTNKKRHQIEVGGVVTVSEATGRRNSTGDVLLVKSEVAP